MRTILRFSMSPGRSVRLTIGLAPTVDRSSRSITFEIGNLISHAFRQRHPSAPNAHQIEIAGTVVFFYNFRSEAGERAVDSRAIHDARLLDEIHFAGY